MWISLYTFLEMSLFVSATIFDTKLFHNFNSVDKNCPHITLVWIAEKTLVPSNFLLLLKLIFLGSWVFKFNETYVD